MHHRQWAVAAASTLPVIGGTAMGPDMGDAGQGQGHGQGQEQGQNQGQGQGQGQEQGQNQGHGQGQEQGQGGSGVLIGEFKCWDTEADKGKGKARGGGCLDIALQMSRVTKKQEGHAPDCVVQTVSSKQRV